MFANVNGRNGLISSRMCKNYASTLINNLNVIFRVDQKQRKHAYARLVGTQNSTKNYLNWYNGLHKIKFIGWW